MTKMEYLMRRSNGRKKAACKVVMSSYKHFLSRQEGTDSLRRKNFSNRSILFFIFFFFGSLFFRTFYYLNFPFGVPIEWFLGFVIVTEVNYYFFFLNFFSLTFVRFIFFFLRLLYNLKINFSSSDFCTI